MSHADQSLPEITRKQRRAGHQFDNINDSLEPVHSSVRTLKTLIVEVKNIDHLVTMICVVKPWVLIFMWMPLDVHHPPEHCCRTSMIGLVPSQTMDAGLDWEAELAFC